MRLPSRVRRFLSKTPVLWRYVSPEPSRVAESSPEGPEGIRDVGHRRYVGGRWEEIGRLQFSFLVSEGLRPEHRLLDIACGPLRAGVHFIPYLEAGHYMGLDREEILIRSGVEEELGRTLYELKRPRFVVSADFEFEKFDQRPDFALAQSLFTHLTREDIGRCLRRLRPVMPDIGRFYATFFEVAEPVRNRDRSHARLPFWYTVDELRELARDTGWRTTYIGDWGHPRDQKMVLFRPVST